MQAAEPVVDYAVRIAQATRTSPHVRLGAGPRGSVALIRAAKVRAASQERGHVLPEDIKALAEPVLTHRLLLSLDAELSGRTAEAVLADILSGGADARRRRPRGGPQVKPLRRPADPARPATAAGRAAAHLGRVRGAGHRRTRLRIRLGPGPHRGGRRPRARRARRAGRRAAAGR
ncbi:AAA family ATPase [Yinghuangia aomiensis]